jgi:hypothetical protein
VGVADPWAAYQLDLAVAQFGTWVENMLAERDKQGKPKHTLAKLLGDTAGTQEFAPLHIDPAGLRKVRVREDGTWEE